MERVSVALPTAGNRGCLTTNLGGARRAETWLRLQRVADLQFFVLLRTEDRLLVSAWLV